MPLEFEKAWSDLNARLRRLEQGSGLPAALLALEAHQRKSGFIEDTIEQLERYTLYHPDDPMRYFRAQYNPRRALRFAGSGSREARSPTHENGCFLCRENIQWQQQGTQLGYRIETGERAYFALMNPFPLLPAHAVMASTTHLPQDWRFRDDGGLDVAMLLGDLVQLGDRLPGHLGFYNGVNAGATIPSHLHYQFFKRPDDLSPFPLEIATGTMRENMGGPGFAQDYPLDAAVWKGDAEDVVARASDWIVLWAERNRIRLDGLAANFIASRNIEDDDVTLYFVPRDRTKPRAARFSNLIGGIEVLGEFVLSRPEDKARLSDGQIDYFTLEAALASVRTPIEVD